VRTAVHVCWCVVRTAVHVCWYVVRTAVHGEVTVGNGTYCDRAIIMF